VNGIKAHQTIGFFVSLPVRHLGILFLNAVDADHCTIGTALGMMSFVGTDDFCMQGMETHWKTDSTQLP
jgi:hypothetical protein